MKIDIKNLGAIRSASIDLDRRLTVFCGANNTGKTYMAYVVYALNSSANTSYVEEALGESEMQQILGGKSIKISIKSDLIYAYKLRSAKYTKDNMDSIFGISDEAAEKLFKDFELSFSSTREECGEKLQSLSYNTHFIVDGLGFGISKEKESFEVIIVPDEDNDYKSEGGLPMFILRTAICSAVYHRTAFFPIMQSAIFPVERNSIYTFNKELSLSRNALIDQLQKLPRNEKLNPFDLIDQRSKRYPEAIKDGLRIANDLTEIKKRKGKYFDLAEEIEMLLLDGKLDVSNDGDVIFYPNKARKADGRLQIHMTASIVKTMSSLVFYLKYLAEEDELIIIDEPEMNLHPDSQIILVKILAKLMNKGLRVLISTHSDYIIRELNNLIMVSSIREKGKTLPEGYIFDNDILLKKEDVGVYYFSYIKKRKVDVKSVAVDDNGFDVESINDAIEKQNEESEELYYKLKYSNNDSDM